VKRTEKKWEAFQKWNAFFFECLEAGTVLFEMPCKQHRKKYAR
jgi:hypothetical protein